MKRPAVFLDRDGTLIREVNYLSSPEQVEPLPGAVEAVRRINRAGIAAIVVTNQSAVARGIITEEELGEIHRRLQSLFAAGGALFEAVYYCPHHPQAPLPHYRRNCSSRKPEPGLILRAAREWELAPGRSLTVGDRLIDVEAGHRAGTRAALVQTGYGLDETGQVPSEGPARPDWISPDLASAVRQWLG